MTSNTIPVYRHGRKFYVSTDEYERINSEDRRQRRIVKLKSQHLPVSKAQQIPTRSTSTSLYNPIQRSQSNPYEYKYGILKTPHLPVNSLINTNNRYATNRSSRSILKKYDDQDDLSSITSSITMKTRVPNTRSNSSDKFVDIQRTPLSSDSENDIKHSLSSETTLSFQEQKPKQQQQSQVSSRRPVPTTISDYGISPITTFSMTPDDQSCTQTNISKLTNYFARMKQSSLNPPSKTSSSTMSGNGSLFESGIKGSDNVYSVLGTSNRRTGTTASSSLLMRSPSDNSKHDYYHADTTSGNSFSDENSSSLLALIQRRNTELIRSRQPEYINEIVDDHNQQRDLWTRSTVRSQSSDGLTEKKRVRFADMEGFTLETIPNSNQLKSSINNRLLTRRQHGQISSDSDAQSRPFHSTLYQTTAKVGGSKLATDV